MRPIAFILDDIFIYWDSILLVLGGITGLCLFLAFWLARGGRWAPGILAAAGSLLLSLLLSRLTHWDYHQALYPGFQEAMTDFASGGFSLLGVLAACTLTACLLYLLRLHQELPAMLDCMSPAVAAAVAAGCPELLIPYGIIFSIITAIWLLRGWKLHHQPGDTALVFLALHTAAQLLSGNWGGDVQLTLLVTVLVVSLRVILWGKNIKTW